MTLEDGARKIVEKMLVEIHWQGKKSTHPDDLKWLENRIGMLLPDILPLLEDATRNERKILATYFRDNYTSSLSPQEIYAAISEEWDKRKA